MPATTPTWNLRYPLYTEGTNAASQIQNLATDINTALGTVNGQVTAAQVKRGAFIRRATNQAIADNTSTNLTFATEQFDNDNMANLGADNTLLTVVTTGLYLLVARNNWAPNATGNRVLAFLLNGSIACAIRDEAAGGGATTNQSLSALLYAGAGSTLRLQCRQNSGVSVNSSLSDFSALRMA